MTILMTFYSRKYNLTSLLFRTLWATTMEPFLITCLRWEAIQGYHQQSLPNKMKLQREELGWEVTEKNWGHRKKCSDKPIALIYSYLETILPSHSMICLQHSRIQVKNCKVTESSKRKFIWINIKAWKRTLFLMVQTCPLHLEWQTCSRQWALTELYFHRVGISRWDLWDLHMAVSR